MKIKYRCLWCGKLTEDYPKNKSKFCSRECYNKYISKYPYWKGKQRSEKTKQKIRETLLKQRDIISQRMKGNKHGLGHKLSEEAKRKLSELNKGRKHTEETKKKLSKIIKQQYTDGKRDRYATTKKAREKVKQLMSNPEIKEKWIKRMRLGCNHKPTSLEKKFIEIIKKYNLPLRYVGDGKCWIESKNPDFIGDHLIVEVATPYKEWHPDGWFEEREKIFKKYGYKTLVFWGNRRGTSFEKSEKEIVSEVMKYV